MFAHTLVIDPLKDLDVLLFVCAWHDGHCIGGDLPDHPSMVIIRVGCDENDQLRSQQAEMTATREEFQIARLTNIIYNQFRRYEDSVRALKLRGVKNTQEGEQCFVKLLDMTDFSGGFDLARTMRRELEYFSAICEFLTYCSQNSNNLYSFSLSAYSATEVVGVTLAASELKDEDISELRDLYFNNVGRIHLRVFSKIITYLNDYDRLIELGNEEILNYPDDHHRRLTVDYHSLKPVAQHLEWVLEIATYSIPELKDWYQNFIKSDPLVLMPVR